MENSIEKNNNEQAVSPQPQEQKEKSKLFGINQSGTIIVVIAVIFILAVVGVLGYYLLGKNKLNTSIPGTNTNNQSVPSITQTPKTAPNDFFLFSIPKPISNLSILNLPNTASIRNVIPFKDSLWFAGGGNLVEYDTKSGKLVSYSDLTKVNCDSNVVMANNFLFTSCHSDNVEDAFGHTEQLTSKIFTGHYSVYKINPSTHEVEHIFNDKDGLQNRYNYTLFTDGDTVWIQTFKGVGRINTTTNQVKFYTNELDIPGSTLSISWMLVDQNYVWVAIGANVGSQGGLSMYDKKTQTWKAFNVHDLKDYSTNRFDLEAGFKSIPGGVQIAFRDGNLDTSDRLVEKQYNYQTGQWTKINIERPASGAQSEATRQYIKATYPSPFNYQKVDQFGLTQLQLPNSNQVYQLDGRNNYILSPMVGDKRYILTSATVDVIDDSSAFRQILVKLGSLPSSGVSYGDPTAYEGLVSFFVDSSSSLAVVVDPDCAGQGCKGGQKAWLIDLKTGKVNKVYTTKSDNLPTGDLLYNLSMSREGNLLVIKDKSGKLLFNIDTTNYSLSLPQK